MNRLLRLKHQLGKHPRLRPIVVNIDPQLTGADFRQAARIERERRQTASRSRADQPSPTAGKSQPE